MKGTNKMYIEIRELKGSVYDLSDTECGKILRELQRETSITERDTAEVIIVEGYLCKNRHDSLSSTEGILADIHTNKYLILEDCKKVSVSAPNKLYLTRDVMERVFNYIDTPVRKAEELYTKLEEVIQPYMWDTCGYNPESNAFDIVLAVKDIIENLDYIAHKNHTSQRFYFPMYNVEEFKHELQEKYKDTVSDGLAATVLWCAITSTLSRKYKQLTETDGTNALAELVNLVNTLDEHDFINRDDIEKVM